MKAEAQVIDKVSIATRWAIPCLILGAFLGMLIGKNDSVVEPFQIAGEIWTNYLRLCAIPLVLLLLFSAIVRLPAKSEAKRTTVTFFVTMICILLFGVLISVLAHVANWNLFNPGLFPFSDGATTPVEPVSISTWLRELVPNNLVAAAVEGDILPLLVAISIFAFAVRFSSETVRSRLLEFFESLLEVVMIMIRWGIMLLPLGVLSLSFVFSATSGLHFLQIALQFLVLSVIALTVGSILLLSFCSLISRKSPLRVFGCVLPSIVAAASTRSSLACLPCMVNDVESNQLASERAASFSLPLAVAVLKANRTISGPLKLLFVAGISSVYLTIPQICVFVLTTMLLSVASPGIPRTGSQSGLGIYIALGLPVSTILLFDVVEPVIDIFKTIYNVIADISITMVVGSREPA